MKPLHKVVTASDVQSCLYYVHVDNIEDERLRESLEAEQRKSEERDHRGLSHNGDGSWREPTVREPLSTHQNRSELPPKISTYAPHAHPSRPNGLPERKPVGSGMGVRPKDTDFHSTQNLLGPRPMHQHLHSVSATRSDIESEQNPSRKWWSDQPLAGSKPGRNDWPNEEPSKGFLKQQETDGDTIQEYDRSSQSTVRSARSDYDRDASLTLIRRYDGSQWNVAKISSPSFSYPDEPYQIQNGISVAILSPGYAKFTDRAVLSDQEIASEENTICFKRELLKANDRKRPELETTSGSHRSTLSMQGLKTKLKIGKGVRHDSNDDPSGKATVHSKGYTFHSPWGGICELSVGIAGQSLKCKHIINSFRAGAETIVPSISVSELRFNLPSPKSPDGSSNGSQSVNNEPKDHKRFSFLTTKDTGHPSPSESFNDQTLKDAIPPDERLGLSLAQEQAAGGFGGKQAKLGKLIIEKEGFKMLDLVVAANIGLWWRAYGKNVSLMAQ